jgi:DNA-binding LacI/PurR family transcriptional regulator
VTPITTGVPGAQSVAFDNHKAAAALYTAAFSQGIVRRIVVIGGAFDDETSIITRSRRPRRSSESSIWGKVTDIDDVAAEWRG